MKLQLREIIPMASVTLLLYELFWLFFHEEGLEGLFTAGHFPFIKIGVDISICLLLTTLSVIYSRLMMLLLEGRHNLLTVMTFHTLALFILDILTAWALCELSTLLTNEHNFIAFFLKVFILALLATFVSSTKTNALFLERKIQMEREQALMKSRMLEEEKRNAEAKLQHLQAQINPHFFFNNLSALSSLISSSPEAAKEFVLALSELYRHLHQNMKHDLVSLNDELLLAKEYARLLHIRHGESLKLTMPEASSLPPDAAVPPGSLQHLVENAVKHNAMLPDSPLLIIISCNSKWVSVTNNLQPLAGIPPHSGTGLANLEAQLQLRGLPSIRRNKDNKQFSISIPLITQKQHE